MNFMGLLSIEVALKAVERTGGALQYVLNKDLFIAIAAKLNIRIEL